MSESDRQHYSEAEHEVYCSAVFFLCWILVQDAFNTPSLPGQKSVSICYHQSSCSSCTAVSAAISPNFCPLRSLADSYLSRSKNKQKRMLHMSAINVGCQAATNAYKYASGSGRFFFPCLATRSDLAYRDATPFFHHVHHWQRSLQRCS